MKSKGRKGYKIMLGLIGLIKPLLGYMILAILLGCLGNLAATFITILGGYGMLSVLNIEMGLSLGFIFTALVILAVSRGILRYGEQSCNHFIAFKILARIRHMVFAVLRKLAPAKLDHSEKGNLISILTTDVELLEVFYAHTISPIAIAVITSVVMIAFIGSIAPILGLLAAIFYLLVGFLIPYVNGRLGGTDGVKYRNHFGKLNTIVLDNLYGLEEILQYNQKETRQEQMAKKTEKLEAISEGLKDKEANQRIVTDTVILIAGAVVLLVSQNLVTNGDITFGQAVIAVISMMSSFGPTAALSALSNNLHQTLASGDRVLTLLEEEPVTKEILDGVPVKEQAIDCDKVSFHYENEDKKVEVLNDFDASFSDNKIYGIHGKSGCGKSTLLKLMMRFYETKRGEIRFGEHSVNEIKTQSLRDTISYVTQETFLFHDTIENNIKVAKADATRDEVIEAAKKASIHDFIMTLEKGYDTLIAELGDSVSGGERQRIGIARAFLHGSKILLLDEPTSNIDSLNEGIILKSLDAEKKDKTIVLVSHRKSTMGIADVVIEM